MTPTIPNSHLTISEHLPKRVSPVEGTETTDDDGAHLLNPRMIDDDDMEMEIILLAKMNETVQNNSLTL